MRPGSGPAEGEGIQDALLGWQRVAGRHDLPWQHPRTPYRVWVSEVMLQQTRVETAIPYFERFMERFPDAATLAHSREDEVLALWSGLGYYRRARNLRAAALRIVEHHGGEPPTSLEELKALPGVGPSTAGAIRSLGHGLPAPILDGNVKRILARVFRIPGWPGRAPVERVLWEHASALVPTEEAARFNQALMDLGASICTPSAPACTTCPIEAFCGARADDAQVRYPEPRPGKVSRRVETTRMLVLHHSGSVLLVRRPPSGVWAGLWSLPEPEEGEAPEQAAGRLGLRATRLRAGETFVHRFSHFDLRIEPLHLRVDDVLATLDDETRWHAPGRDTAEVGIPAPIGRILRTVTATPTGGPEFA